MNYSAVCHKIRELRIRKGFTQLQLAQLLGISKSVVSSYENAVHLPPYDILIKLSSVFGVSCDYLLGVESQDTISVKGLTETQIQSVESIVNELRDMNQNANK